MPAALLNPDVTPTTITATICQPGWTATVRPPSSYTTKLKLQQLAQHGYTDQDPGHYEEDHWIPLELGGAPYEPANLWPEPLDEARHKDVAENAAHRAVCAGTLNLETARWAMFTDWGPR